MVKNKQLIRAEEENDSLKRTLRYISHEMLNILTLVDYSVKAVGGAVTQVKDNEYWHYITSDVDCMVQMVKELSEYNHCSELKKEKCVISDLVRNISEEMHEKYREKANIISCIERDREFFTVYIDKRKIRQVMVNLIKNAVEAMKDRTDGLIMVCLNRNKEWIEIQVIDNGCGISAENLDNIFEEGVTIGKENGSGLGLAITKKIVESHGGSISVSSAVNQGTVFKIRIPAMKF